MTCDVTVLINWGRDPLDVLYTSLQKSLLIHLYTPHHISNLSHLYLYMMPLFLVMKSLSFGATRRSFIVLPPLKYTCMPCFLHVFFETFTETFCVCYCYVIPSDGRLGLVWSILVFVFIAFG